MWGVFPDAIDWNIALHTQTLIWASKSEVGFQKPFQRWSQFYRFLCSESVFLESHFRYTHQKKKFEWAAQYPSLLPPDKHPHMPTFEAFNFF